MTLDCDTVKIDRTATPNEFIVEKINRRDPSAFTNFRASTTLLPQSPNSFLSNYLGLDRLSTVVSTDYVSYALVYICMNTTPKTYEAILYSRTPSLPVAELMKLRDYARNTLLLRKRFYSVLQNEEVCGIPLTFLH